MNIIENEQTVILNSNDGVIRVDAPPALGESVLVSVQSFGESGAQGRFIASKTEIIAFMERALASLKKGEI